MPAGPRHGRGWARRPGAAGAAIAAGTAFAVWSDSFKHKILFDEFVIQGTAYYMHITKQVSTILRAYNIAGTWLPIDPYLDKRPYFFPFLVSLLHDLDRLPRSQNMFALNVACASALLGLLYWFAREICRLGRWRSWPSPSSPPCPLFGAERDRGRDGPPQPDDDRARRLPGRPLRARPHGRPALPLRPRRGAPHAEPLRVHPLHSARGRLRRRGGAGWRAGQGASSVARDRGAASSSSPTPGTQPKNPSPRTPVFLGSCRRARPPPSAGTTSRATSRATSISSSTPAPASRIPGTFPGPGAPGPSSGSASRASGGSGPSPRRRSRRLRDGRARLRGRDRRPLHRPPLLLVGEVQRPARVALLAADVPGLRGPGGGARPGPGRPPPAGAAARLGGPRDLAGHRRAPGDRGPLLLGREPRHAGARLGEAVH